MRKNVRVGIATAVTIALTAGLGGAALADGHGAYPSQQQVDSAKAAVASKRGDVAAIRKQLAEVQTRADAAGQQAEIASEAYNGAMWRLSLARKAAVKARAAATAARQRVSSQRAGIAQLVVQSYQEGTSLNSITALLGAGGPEAMMGRTSVVDMAGDSLRADYDSFVTLSTAAEAADRAAVAAAASQQKIANQARSARATAGAAAAHAQQLANQVAGHRDALIAELAKAEHTSVALATQRQQALEEIARKKAEAEARREAAAAAAKARAEAAKTAAQQKANAGSTNTGSQGDGVAPTTSAPAPNSGAAAAIAFAKAQLGEPYQWAAAGPNRWDCSGLTMMAWRAGGISLPHFSGAQYDQGTPISIGDARPGDLLFWSYNGRPSGIHHVALYLGNGSFIEAPHTGADVRYNTIYNEYPNFAVRL